MVICLSVLVLQPIQGLPPMALAAMNWISKEKWVDFLFLFFFSFLNIYKTLTTALKQAIFTVFICRLCTFVRLKRFLLIDVAFLPTLLRRPESKKGQETHVYH